MDKHDELRGASVILTRPAGGAAALTAAVRRAGGAPVSLPGLSLRAADDSAAVRPRLRSAARAADVALFTSPAAVRFAWRLEPELRFARNVRVGAVGAGTARTLVRYGAEVAFVPEQADSAGLLALSALADVRGREVAVIGAPGGRDLLVPTLRQRGARVDRIDVYRRAAPRWSSRHLDALAAAASPRLLLVSSADALGHLATALPPVLAAALRRSETVVSSARLAALAHELGFEHVHLARSALTADLIAAAAVALARHRL